MNHPSLFQSFFLGGFECSSHRVRSGVRRDLIRATRHDEIARADYERLRKVGILTARDGLRWHLIETKPYHYDFSSVLPMVQAAQASGIQVIWDIFHYGWPDDLDIFQPEFVHRFSSFSRAFAQLLANETDRVPFLSPLNEISYFSWAGGDVGKLHPFAFDRGFELKAQLTRAAIEGIEAIWDVLPNARIVHPEPVINVIADPERPEEQPLAEGYRLAQYQVWDMLVGQLWPWLGGQEKYLDIIGINYYDHNQWLYNGPHLDADDPRYRPLSDILAEVHARYNRPIFIAETGVEGDLRAGWFKYICDEVHTAIEAGVPVEGVCLYPICDYPGWEDERPCNTGLWSYPNEVGERELHPPLAEELRRQQRIFAISGLHRVSQEIATELAKPLDSQDERATVCLFTDSADPSGMGEHMLILAAQLQERYRILFVCPPGEKGDHFLNRAESLGCMALPLAGQNPHLRDKLLHWWLNEMDVAVFHCHAGIGWEGHDGIRAARAAGVPVVVRTEHLPYLLTEASQRTEHQSLLSLVDRLICVSKEAAQSFVAAGIPTEKLHVVHNGIDPDLPERDATTVRAEFGLPPTAKLLLTVARLTEQKGHTYLLNAIPEILKQAPDAHFIWVGEGPLERTLRRQMRELGIDQRRLIFTGRRQDVPRLLAASDLFVLPSLFEGLPLVVLEAMAAGIPVIGTRVCGTREAVSDGLTGRLVSPRDSGALAAAIIEALTQPAQTATWVHAGRQRFVQEFSANRMADATAALYERLRMRNATRHDVVRTFHPEQYILESDQRLDDL